MRTSPLQDIYALCNSGDSRSKYENLPAFPRLIDVELTNTCNFRCLMCPTGNHSMLRKSGFMEADVFYKILEQVAPHKTAIRFIRWGEPTTHPQLIEFIKASREAGCLTHINTNGSKLDRDYIEGLIEAGLDSIKFSFQGVDQKSYEEMRNTDYFEELIEVISLFHEIRCERERPFIQVSTSITYETKEMVHDFRRLMEPVTDQVSVGRTVLEWTDLSSIRMRPDEVATLERLMEEESVVKEHPECPEVFDKLSFNFDGSVTACCGDSDNLMTIGSLHDQAIVEIWQSEKLNSYRELLVEMRHDEIKLCSSCYDYQGLNTPGLQDVD